MRQGDIYLGHRREPRPVASGTWGLLPPSPQRWNARCQANVDLYVYTVVDVTCLEYAVLRAHRFAFVTRARARTLCSVLGWWGWWRGGAWRFG